LSPGCSASAFNPSPKTVRRCFGRADTPLRRRFSFRKNRRKNVAKYLDPKTSRRMSGDPATGDYFPSAPVNDDAKKRNQNLPGMGGVFNYANLHTYHYAGNNPVKYTDLDGRLLIGRLECRKYMIERLVIFDTLNTILAPQPR